MSYPLTDRQVEAGAILTEALDKTGLAPGSAFWLFDADADSWKLVFASNVVESAGPRKAYATIQATLVKLGTQTQEIRLGDTVLMEPTHPLIIALRSAVRTGSGISRIRFSRNRVGSHFIDDALIYRNN